MNIVTAGESHGKGLFAILEGIPAGLELDTDRIDERLRARQGGYGRGARRLIECDRAELLSGVRGRVTIGSPIAIAVWNRDYENWKDALSPETGDRALKPLTAVRPGHADLAGAIKFGQKDARNISERASARSTAVRVAAGEICRQLLEKLDISITGYVRSVGTVCDENIYTYCQIVSQRSEILGMLDGGKEREAVRLIEECAACGDTLGGTVELRAKGLKPGFGSCMTERERLDSRLVAALMSVPSVKGAEIGLGFAGSALRGSEAHDEIFSADGSPRKTNRAGGVEGGMSNGGELVLRAALKPIPTLGRGLRTVDLATGEETSAAAERADVCAVRAGEIVLEAALLCELCAAVLERLGGDTVEQVMERYGRLTG